MEKKLYGTLPTGEEIYIYTLKTDEALVNIMTRGATIVNFKAFGTDIVGGFDDNRPRGKQSRRRKIRDGRQGLYSSRQRSRQLPPRR